VRLQRWQKDTHPNLPTQAFNAASSPLLASAIKRQRSLMERHESRKIQRGNKEVSEKNNYDFLQFLVKDAGYYDVAGHIEVLQKAFPWSNIDIKIIRTLRRQISESNHVVCDSYIARSRQKALKVISVDPRYKIHSKTPSEKLRDKITDSYIRSEPPAVVRQILLVQQFNQLLAPVTRQRTY